jgi:hypothetical protein
MSFPLDSLTSNDRRVIANEDYEAERLARAMNEAMRLIDEYDRTRCPWPPPKAPSLAFDTDNY